MAEYATEVADMIQFTGHSRGVAVQYKIEGSEPVPAAYCIIGAVGMSPLRNQYQVDEITDFYQSLASWIGVKNLDSWSDATETNEVIDALRRYAKAQLETAAA